MSGHTSAESGWPRTDVTLMTVPVDSPVRSPIFDTASPRLRAPPTTVKNGFTENLWYTEKAAFPREPVSYLGAADRADHPDSKPPISRR
jgi:hypothetical protein